MDMMNSKQIKTQHGNMTLLTTYYYYIEDSIIKIYKTTLEYLYPSKKAIEQNYGEFEIVTEDDYTENNGFWTGGKNLLTSIKTSLYVPRINYSSEELENLGYKPLIQNDYFKENVWNCMIYSDNRKYDVLSELIDYWKIKKVNIHIISGPYEHIEYELSTQFTSDLPSDVDVTFHTTYLHEFDKESLLTFIRNNEKEFKFWKRANEEINLTILNQPKFEVDSEVYTEIVGDKKNLIVFESEIERFNRFIDYIIIPSREICRFGHVVRTKYPQINNDDETYAVYSHSDCDALTRQLNYIRLW